MTSRRDFLKTATAVGAAALATPALSRAETLARRAAPNEPAAMDPATKELLLEALDAAKLGGAEFADARIGRYRNNFVITREQQIVNVVDTDSLGVGVRVLVSGTWGFGASRDLTKAGVVAATKEALAIARANALPAADRVRLAPATPTPDGRYVTPHTIDPFTVPIEQKADLLIRANAEAMKVAGVKFVNSNMFFVKEEKNYANTDGTFTTQTVIRSWLPFAATAVAPDFSDFQTRTNVIQPMARGYEYLVAARPVEHARQWGEEAAAKLKAKAVEVGRYDLVLHPSHLWLTIHESIAHPTELDRAMGYEANYAGTSFLAPPREKLGTFRYGPAIMNIQGDRSQEGGCSTIGWDDDGVKPDEFLIIKNGIVNDYQTTREQAPMLDWWYTKQKRPVRSHGCSHSDSWNDVQFQRMPNVSLLPGEKDLGWDDLIAATDRGIAIVGDGSFSIDQQRYNAQFGGQLFYEIKGGRIVGQLKDVAYQMRTPDFWNSMDMIGGRKSYEMGASFFDGKGQPGQVNAVSHGCVPSRFRNVNVINTGRKA
ncbi:MAG: TldD/PmbA family protein [Gemmatimonadaceae bacterium]|nr:TldD/PmbA family protein [Gemmatimonadaceae bacterium]NUS46175.1 TldD/PmbA family protein [Gemmatimonadaceae bacterium]